MVPLPVVGATLPGPGNVPESRRLRAQITKKRWANGGNLADVTGLHFWGLASWTSPIGRLANAVPGPDATDSEKLRETTYQLPVMVS